MAFFTAMFSPLLDGHFCRGVSFVDAPWLFQMLKDVVSVWPILNRSDSSGESFGYIHRSHAIYLQLHPHHERRISDAGFGLWDLDLSSGIWDVTAESIDHWFLKEFSWSSFGLALQALVSQHLRQLYVRDVWKTHRKFHIVLTFMIYNLYDPCLWFVNGYDFIWF